MKHCLFNYIGVLGCSSTAPASGLYINSLAGVSMQKMEAIANEEQLTYLGVWDNIQERAILKLESTLVSKLREKYKLKSLLKSVNLGTNIVENIDSNATTQWKGFNVILHHNSNPSSFVSIYVSQLKFHSKLASERVFKIFDSILGIELYTVTLDVVIGWNIINVDKYFTSKSIFCAVDGTVLNTNSLNISTPAIANLCHDCCNDFHHNTSLKIEGAETIDFNDTSTLAFGEDSFGLSGTISIQCKPDAFICNYKELFKVALLNILGAELMFETIYSETLSRWNTVDLKSAASLKAIYESDYESAIDSIVSSTNLVDVYDDCLECRNEINYVSTIPC